MGLEIAGITLDLLVSIETQESAAFKRHPLPGGEGTWAQDMGRPGVSIRLKGICYGPEGPERLQQLRKHLMDRQPVDFVCELTGEGYCTEVLVDSLEVVQRAGRPEEYAYTCVVTEYLPPPSPPLDLGGSLDASLTEEAAGLMDDMQTAVGELSSLQNLFSGATNFGDPTQGLLSMVKPFSSALAGNRSGLTNLGDLTYPLSPAQNTNDRDVQERSL